MTHVICLVRYPSRGDKNALEEKILEASTFHLVLAPDAAIDLQMHTFYSDGTWTPEQLIEYLVSEQFGLVAITDHDRVDTVASLQQLGAEKQLPILAAVEMSTSWKGELTDVLCYGFNPERWAKQISSPSSCKHVNAASLSCMQSPLGENGAYPSYVVTYLTSKSLTLLPGAVS